MDINQQQTISQKVNVEELAKNVVLYKVAEILNEYSTVETKEVYRLSYKIEAYRK